jgi:ABC-type multidrug transport system ATPase subunit
MEIELTQVGKKYLLEWVLRGVDYQFLAGGRYAITGPNGSGKSTLLKMICGHLTPSKGTLVYRQNGKKIDRSEAYRLLSYAAPYIELIEEFTLEEALQFHRQFKSFQAGLDDKALIALLGFERSAKKMIRNFSSGMKQRLKLVMNICSDTPLLLLDEPTTNLDQQGVEWYSQLIADYGAQRTIIVASNVEVDYAFCTENLDIRNYKTKVKA